MPLKIAFLVAGAVFFCMFIYYLITTDFLNWWFWSFLIDFLLPKKLRRTAVEKKWEKIKKDLNKNQPALWKASLLAGARLLDGVLDKAGFEGQDLDEKLSKVDEEEVPNLDQVKSAAQTCADIARDPDYDLKKSSARKVLAAFEKALKYLQAI